MKKWLLAVVAVVVIAVVAVVGLKMMKAPKKAVISETLPQEVAFYYSIQNVETIWKNVKTSNFWKELTGLKLLQEAQISTGIQDLQKQFKDNIGIDLTEANFMKLAGTQLVIAVIPGKEQTAPPKILLLFEGKNRQDLQSITNPIIEKIKKDDPTKIEETDYKKEKIVHIKAASADQPEIYFFLANNILTVGVGDTLTQVQEVADLSSGQSKTSLASTENFKKLSGFVGANTNVAATFYMDFAKMKSYFSGLTIPGTEGAQAQVNSVGLDSINYIGGWTEIKDGLVTKLYIYPNTSALSPEMKKMWETKPEIAKTLSFTPEKTLLYIGATTIDLPALWNLWQTNLKTQAPDQAQTILNALLGFEKDWGVNIASDVLASLGGEVALIFSDINTEGFIPVPKLGLAVKVNNKDKIEKTITDLTKKNNDKAAAEAAKVAEPTTKSTQEKTAEATASETETAPSLRFQINFKEEDYDGQKIKTIQLPLVGAGIAPGYTYIDDYLVIGATAKTLQEMIDIKKGKGKSILQDSTYAKLASVVPKENNQSTFINMERLMDVATGISGWIANLQQMSIPQGPAPENADDLAQYNQQKAQAEATIATINNSVIPLLNTLKSIKTIATASVNKQDHIEQTMVIRIEDI